MRRAVASPAARRPAPVNLYDNRINAFTVALVLPVWARAILHDIATLIAVERLLWVAFALLTILRLMFVPFLVDGKANPHILKTLGITYKKTFLEGMALFVVTVCANAAPVFGWSVAVVWTVAIYYTGQILVVALLEKDNYLRKWFNRGWRKLVRITSSEDGARTLASGMEQSTRRVVVGRTTRRRRASVAPAPSPPPAQ